MKGIHFVLNDALCYFLRPWTNDIKTSIHRCSHLRSILPVFQPQYDLKSPPHCFCFLFLFSGVKEQKKEDGYWHYSHTKHTMYPATRGVITGIFRHIPKTSNNWTTWAPYCKGRVKRLQSRTRRRFVSNVRTATTIALSTTVPVDTQPRTAFMTIMIPIVSIIKIEAVIIKLARILGFARDKSIDFALFYSKYRFFACDIWVPIKKNSLVLT